jgi:hypothetical protein
VTAVEEEGRSQIANVTSRALTYRCGLCGAKAGEECRNTIQVGRPLPGRRFHHYRLDPQLCTAVQRFATDGELLNALSSSSSTDKEQP